MGQVAVGIETTEYAHMCCDGHHVIGFNDPEDKYSERCPLCSEVDRLVDGIRDHLISLGVPADGIDGAGCDSGDPLDFTKAEITQAFSYFENQSDSGFWPTLHNRGDGVDGHYCIGRLIDPAKPYWEFWNQDKWSSAGEVFVGKEAAQQALLRLRSKVGT